jgi:methyl-accepting chemotaxis protein
MNVHFCDEDSSEERLSIRKRKYLRANLLLVAKKGCFGMEKPKNSKKQAIQAEDSLWIPIFYKMMVSMLFVSAIPICLLGIMAVGGTRSIIAALGLEGTIILITLITITGVPICSYYLSRLITTPIVQLSHVANDLSRGILNQPELPIARNDEIGTLSRAFFKMMNTYRLLDTLATEQ